MYEVQYARLLYGWSRLCGQHTGEADKLANLERRKRTTLAVSCEVARLCGAKAKCASRNVLCSRTLNLSLLSTKLSKYGAKKSKCERRSQLRSTFMGKTTKDFRVLELYSKFYGGRNLVRFEFERSSNVPSSLRRV